MQRQGVAPVFAVFALVAATARGDQIDDYVRARMKEFALPGVSLAILENGRITRMVAYACPIVAEFAGHGLQDWLGQQAIRRDRDHAARPGPPAESR